MVVAFEGEVGVWVVVVVVVRPCGCVHGRLVAGWLRTRGGGGGADRVGFWTEAGARGEVRVWESEWRLQPGPEWVCGGQIRTELIRHSPTASQSKGQPVPETYRMIFICLQQES